MLKIKCVIHTGIFLVHYLPVSVTHELNPMFRNYMLTVYIMPTVRYY